MFLDRPSDQLDVYIKNLERVLDAIEFFNQNNQNCLELANLVSALPYIKSLSVCLSAHLFAYLCAHLSGSVYLSF